MNFNHYALMSSVSLIISMNFLILVLYGNPYYLVIFGPYVLLLIWSTAVTNENKRKFATISSIMFSMTVPIIVHFADFFAGDIGYVVKAVTLWGCSWLVVITLMLISIKIK